MNIDSEYDLSKLPEINKVEFQTIINRIFAQYKEEYNEEELKNFCINPGKIQLKSYQKFIGEYMKRYRGLLVYWGLGSGKSLGAVTVMNTINKDVLIILPASLKQNFEYYVKRYYKRGKRVTYISYNAPNFLAQVRLAASEKGNPFNNKLIIIDECHVFFQNTISASAKQAGEVLQLLLMSRDSKYLFLSGTPIVGDPFELVPMFNILRGPMDEEGNPSTGGYYALPKDIEEFYELFVSEQDNSIKNRDVFQDRIAGLVSYYPGIIDPESYVVPKNLGMSIIECPMGTTQWGSYLQFRQYELDFERRAKYATKEFKQRFYKKAGRASVGTYKMYTSQICNFAFPPDVEKKFKEQAGAEITKEEIAERKWRLMMETMTINDVRANLPSLSGKLVKFLDNITSVEGKKIFVFSRFKIIGVRVIARLLETYGWREIKTPNITDDLPDGKAFIIIDGDTKDKNGMVQTFNRKDNIYGNKCAILLGTMVVAAGVSLKDVREIHILEPQWRDVTINQVIGRGIRTCSHSRLRREERDVKTYLYISIPPTKNLRTKLDIDAGRTTDEFLYNQAIARSELLNTFLEAIKEAAVDCALNTKDICRQCDNQGIALYPGNVRKHIIEGSKCVFTKKRMKLIDWTSPEGKKMKRDVDGNVFDFIDGEWTHIGFIDRDGKFIRHDVDEFFIAQ